MKTDIKGLSLRLSEGYRAARRLNSILCAITLAWSAAQFDLKTLSMKYIGNIDFSRASIPVILICTIAYTTTRCVLEFAMQAVEVRRWGYAQTDFKLSINLVRFTILILAASGLSRSVEAVIYVGMAAVGVFLLYNIGMFFGIWGFSFFFFKIQKRRGYYRSAASTAFAAVSWTELVVICILSIIFIVLGIASLKYDPLSSLWATPPSPFAMGFFIFVCISTMLSLYITPMLYEGLFAIPPSMTQKELPNGKIGVAFHDRIPTVWNWYSQNISDEKSQEEKSGE